jgi:hypothetical protein
VLGSYYQDGGPLNGDLGGQPRRELGAVDTRTGRATPWNPHPNESALALSVERDVVWLGGYFNGIDWESRPLFAALDLRTGQPQPWSPAVDGQAVMSLAVAGNTLYMGGSFNRVNGQDRTNLAAIDVTTGALKPWDPVAIGGFSTRITALLPVGDRVWVGGGFAQIGGQRRANLAAVDTVNGMATTWSADADDWVQALALHNGKLVAGGWFQSVAGVSRNYLAQVDTATGAPSAWNPNANSIVNALAVSGDTVFAGGYFTSIATSNRTALAALDGTTGAVLDWDAHASDNVRMLKLDNGHLYVGGDFGVIGGQPRAYLASLDPATASATAWDVHASGWVGALAFAGDQAYVGGAFSTFGASSAGNLFTVAADRATAATRIAQEPSTLLPERMWLSQSAPNPASASATIRYGIPYAQSVRLDVYDLQGRRVVSVIDGSRQAAGEHAVTIPTAHWRAGIYLLRMHTGAGEQVRKLMVVH